MYNNNQTQRTFSGSSSNSCKESLPFSVFQNSSKARAEILKIFILYIFFSFFFAQIYNFINTRAISNTHTHTHTQHLIFFFHLHNNTIFIHTYTQFFYFPIPESVFCVCRKCNFFIPDKTFLPNLERPRLGVV